MMRFFTNLFFAFFGGAVVKVWHCGDHGTAIVLALCIVILALYEEEYGD